MSRKNPTAIASIKKIHGVEIEDIQDEPTGTPVKSIKPVKAAKKTVKMAAVVATPAKTEKVADEAKLARRAKRAARRAARKAAGGEKAVKTPKAPKVVDQAAINSKITRRVVEKELMRLARQIKKHSAQLKTLTVPRAVTKVETKLKMQQNAFNVIVQMLPK